MIFNTPPVCGSTVEIPSMGGGGELHFILAKNNQGGNNAALKKQTLYIRGVEVFFSLTAP